MIAIMTQSVEGNLFGQSKWWGFPDLPEELDWPSVPVNDDGDEYDDPLTFICQIRCEELAPLDPEGLLPHTGMLWFFASLDYFLGNLFPIRLRYSHEKRLKVILRPYRVKSDSSTRLRIMTAWKISL